MKKDFYDVMDAKLAIRQGTMFRAFFINLILGAIILALTLFVPWFLLALVVMTGISPMVIFFSAISGIALWQMIGIVIFLVPAIAIWWQRKTLN